MGHYDLYGNSYRTALEALNAEMAQCAEIDFRIQEKEVRSMQYQLSSALRRIKELENKIEETDGC